jgi:hypothetical protein
VYAVVEFVVTRIPFYLYLTLMLDSIKRIPMQGAVTRTVRVLVVE